MPKPTHFEVDIFVDNNEISIARIRLIYNGGDEKLPIQDPRSPNLVCLETDGNKYSFAIERLSDHEASLQDPWVKKNESRNIITVSSKDNFAQFEENEVQTGMKSFNRENVINELNLAKSHHLIDDTVEAQILEFYDHGVNELKERYQDYKNKTADAAADLIFEKTKTKIPLVKFLTGLFQHGQHRETKPDNKPDDQTPQQPKR